jgi:hypothetical protein
MHINTYNIPINSLRTNRELSHLPLQLYPYCESVSVNTAEAFEGQQ